MATSHPLAVQAGFEVMARGGNAVEGALAAAITLVVVEPTNNGLGADAFAVVARTRSRRRERRGTFASRPRCARLAACERMPLLGWDSVTVPGAVALWQDLSRRYGRLAFADLFPRAIAYARDGYPVSPVTAELWQTVAPLYDGFTDFAEAFLPHGRAPRAGESFALPALADSLELLACDGAQVLYRGALGERVASCARAAGAALTEQDLAEHEPGSLPTPGGGDTVYLTAADAEGAMVSFIQSNYFAFGSGLVVPGTGISLQIRGACFSTAAAHPNRVGPCKRPFHTIIPAFVTRDSEPVMSFGVMGGAMQAQGHVQVMVRMVDHGCNPQAAIDAPRWQVSGGLDVARCAARTARFERGPAARYQNRWCANAPTYRRACGPR